MKLPANSDFREAFVLRPEVNLLYDRRHGIEHHLNHSALEFARFCLLESDHEVAISKLEEIFDVGSDSLEADYKNFLLGIFQAKPGDFKDRKSGTPSYLSSVTLDFPLAIEIELTKVCNWHCDFCYNVWKIPDELGKRSNSIGQVGKASHHLNLSTLNDILQEAKENSCLRVRFSGGEPTLHPQFKETIKMAYNLGFDVELFTNGSRIDAPMAKYLANHGVRVVLLSIHGLEETHKDLVKNSQAFSHAITAAQNAIDEGMVVVAEALVCEHNEDEMPKLAAILSGMGVNHMSFMPYVPSSPDDPRGPVSLKQIKGTIERSRTSVDGNLDFHVPCAPKHCLEVSPKAITSPVDHAFDNHCGAGTLWMSVSYDGRLRHCPHSKVYAGHTRDGIAQVWQDKIVPTVKRTIEPQTDACAACSQFSACRGGCHLNKVTSYDVSEDTGVEYA